MIKRCLVCYKEFEVKNKSSKSSRGHRFKAKRQGNAILCGDNTCRDIYRRVRSHIDKIWRNKQNE